MKKIVTLLAGIEAAKEHFGATRIEIEAQEYESSELPRPWNLY